MVEPYLRMTHAFFVSRFSPRGSSARLLSLFLSLTVAFYCSGREYPTASLYCDMQASRFVHLSFTDSVNTVSVHSRGDGAGTALFRRFSNTALTWQSNAAHFGDFIYRLKHP